MATIVDYLAGLVLPYTPTDRRCGPATTLAAFRQDFYQCLNRRADALFELSDAVLCADGPVTSLVGLSLAAEHRRGHGALYDAVNAGRIDVARLRVRLAGLPLPRMADGRIVLAVDVSSWLRPDAATSPDRLFCHVYGRGKGQAQLLPGWPYSFVAGREPGRTSWTAILDAVRLGPADEATAVTVEQLRAVVGRLIAAGHWHPGDAHIVIVMDTGYDVTRLAYVLADLPMVLDRASRGWRGFTITTAGTDCYKTSAARSSTHPHRSDNTPITSTDPPRPRAQHRRPRNRATSPFTPPLGRHPGWWRCLAIG